MMKNSHRLFSTFFSNLFISLYSKEKEKKEVDFVHLGQCHKINICNNLKCIHIRDLISDY